MANELRDLGTMATGPASTGASRRGRRPAPPAAGRRRGGSILVTSPSGSLAALYPLAARGSAVVPAHGALKGARPDVWPH
jgi:hypothetical protein